MARQERITVMLEGSVKERFHFYASAMGLTDSALGAFLLGNYVYQQDSVTKPMLDQMQAMMKDAVGEEIQEIKKLLLGGMNLDAGEDVPAHVEQGRTAPAVSPINS